MPVIVRLTPPGYEEAVPELARVLFDVVEGGASVGWPGALSEEDATAWWASLADGVRAGKVVVLVARDEGRLIGTAQLRLAEPPNGRHRADVAKVLVLRSHRRGGVATALMRQLELEAVAIGRTLLMLDTVTGGAAEALYRRLGWLELGVVPNYARVAGGRLVSTTYFYRDLSELNPGVLG